MRLDCFHPYLALAAALLVGSALFLLIRRRKDLGLTLIGLFAAAQLLLALAVGQPHLIVPDSTPIQVLLDVSPSTRTAEYRDPSKLAARLQQLLPRQSFSIASFGQDALSTTLPAIHEPTLLFSDGQFPATQAAGPVFSVLDPALLAAQDARVSRLFHERGKTMAIIRNSSPQRQLTFPQGRQAIAPGDWRVTLDDDDTGAFAELNGDDPWPENDRLDLPPAPPPGVRQVSVGLPTLAGVFSKTPADLPTSPASYLNTSLLVLNASSIPALSQPQQTAISSWVSNLGGRLLLIGQDARWAQMRSSSLAQISPLSVDPPESQRTWDILIDASGSMNDLQAGRPRWQFALDAARRFIAQIPSHDAVRLGTFAQGIRWWQTAPADQLTPIPPSDFLPRGPTNLQTSLAGLLAGVPGGSSHCIVFTDADLEMVAPSGLALAFHDKRTTLSVVALSEGRGIPALRKLADDTGGQLVGSPDALSWNESAAELARHLAPSRWNTHPIKLTLHSPFPSLTASVPEFNFAWARDRATSIARAQIDGQPFDLAATWPVGLGQVTAASWPVDPDQVLMLARQLAHAPSDDRFSVNWLGNDSLLQVKGDARAITLHISADKDQWTLPLQIIAPQLFELQLPSLYGGAELAVIADGSVIATRILPARYPPEFDVIGINLPNLQSLSASSGARVIWPDDAQALSVRRDSRTLALAPWVALASLLAGAASIPLLRRKL